MIVVSNREQAGETGTAGSSGHFGRRLSHLLEKVEGLCRVLVKSRESDAFHEASASLCIVSPDCVPHWSHSRASRKILEGSGGG